NLQSPISNLQSPRGPPSPSPGPSPRSSVSRLSQLPQPPPRLLQRRLRLAKGKARQRLAAAGRGVESAGRDGRHPHLGGQVAAESHVILKAQVRDVDHYEISTFGRDGL